MTEVDALSIIKTASSLCRATYAYAGDVPTEWDFWDDGTDDGVVWGLKMVNGVWFEANRGSVKLFDWFLDAEAIAVWNADLKAHVHPGFNYGMQKVWQRAKATIAGKPWVSCGHSLGAARAANITGYAIVDGHPPIARVAFGEPKSGWKDMADLVARAPGFSLINEDAGGCDKVPSVPLTMAIEPYERGSPLLGVTKSPPPYDGIDEFRYHHMQLYDSASQALTEIPAQATGDLQHAT